MHNMNNYLKYITEATISGLCDQIYVKPGLTKANEESQLIVGRERGKTEVRDGGDQPAVDRSITSPESTIQL